MRVAAHVFRRGAVYTWRRRIPASCGIGSKSPYIQVSLKTRDPGEARHLGAVLHGESARVFEQMASDRLTPEEARTWLEHAVTSELARIRDRRLVELDSADRKERADDLLVDELAAHAYRLLARHGASAVFSPEEDAEIATRAFTEDQLRRGRDLLEILRRDFWSESRYARTRGECERVLGREIMPLLLYIDLRRLKLQGRAIAYKASIQDDDAHDLTPAVEAAKRKVLQQSRDTLAIYPDIDAAAGGMTAPDASVKEPTSTGQANPADSALGHAAAEKTRLAPSSKNNGAYSCDLVEVAARLIEKKRKAGTRDKTLLQITQIIETFVEITGVQDVTALRQHHISRYIDTLGKLPKSYRKSPKDHDKPISYFVEMGSKSLPPDKIGLSANTVNRNLGFLGMVLKRARSEGQSVDAAIDLTELREKRSRREREEWRAFTEQEVQALFRNPLWTGCFSKHRRRRAGGQVIKDAHFWAPLIAALSGARREEIAGLAPDDVREIDGIWCFDIRPNVLRVVKNDNATRIVPVHSQLIELGLLDRVKERQGHADLFPELRPSTDKTSYGDQLDHLFRQVVTDQVEDRDRKSFHSFRHYVVDVFTNMPDLRPEHRDDILGHQGQGMHAGSPG
jgi:hypothetical protein